MYETTVSSYYDAILAVEGSVHTKIYCVILKFKITVKTLHKSTVSRVTYETTGSDYYNVL